MDLENRPYQTYLDRKVPENEIEILNLILEKHIANTESINLWDLNVITYTAAITLLERQGNLKPSKPTDSVFEARPKSCSRKTPTGKCYL